nr:hypothetical protein [Tanacetum cinerariifolium]
MDSCPSLYLQLQGVNHLADPEVDVRKCKKSQNDHSHPFKVNVIFLVDFKFDFLPPMGTKRIAKVDRDWFLGCDLRLDFIGGGKEGE